jgi:sugar phosphate isomerase/epimerase
MTLTRREFTRSAAIGAAGILAGAAEPAEGKPAGRSELGIVLYSYFIRARVEKDQGFAAPLKFAEFCHARGAAGAQLPLGRPDEAAAEKLRRRCADLGMFLEGSVRPPADAGDLDRFEAEVRAAKVCGAVVLRSVVSGGRRYEVFHRADDYRAFAHQAEQSLRLAEPIVRRHGIKLAVENHKDYRCGELADQLRRLSSAHVGACVDTGNNVALLEDPLVTVQMLAPWAMTVHLKDMAVEEARDGFLLAEVPLGQGFLDLKQIVRVLRQANPKVRLNLEMITRDPLSIPCLNDSYWATMERVPGRDLARTLALVRAKAPRKPLPRVGKLDVAEQLKVEDRHVKESLEFARSLS